MVYDNYCEVGVDCVIYVYILNGFDMQMASRKRKSIGSRPTTQYDTRRFSSLDAWNRYTNNVLGRNILPERKVELYHTELNDFKTELVRRNFHKRLNNLVDGSIDLALVKSFMPTSTVPRGLHQNKSESEAT